MSVGTVPLKGRPLSIAEQQTVIPFKEEAIH